MTSIKLSSFLIKTFNLLALTAYLVLNIFNHIIILMRFVFVVYKKSNRKAMNRNWRNQKANPALKTKTRNK